MSLVVPAVLPASKKELEEKLELFSHIPSVNRVQIDVVDGRFASPASWSYKAPKELKDMCERGEMLPHLHQIEYEIDCMCIDAEQEAGKWLALGASRLVFHIGSATDISKLLASAKERYGVSEFASLISFGAALNIGSDLMLIEPCIGEIDFVQFMGIAHIGKQGQPFDKRVLEKIRTFRTRHPELPVQVDGGISLENAKSLVTLGVSNLIIGSALTRASNPAAVVESFEELRSPYSV